LTDSANQECLPPPATRKGTGLLARSIDPPKIMSCKSRSCRREIKNDGEEASNPHTRCWVTSPPCPTPGLGRSVVTLTGNHLARSPKRSYRSDMLQEDHLWVASLLEKDGEQTEQHLWAPRLNPTLAHQVEERGAPPPKSRQHAEETSSP
jgi:hypothetical protein